MPMAYREISAIACPLLKSPTILLRINELAKRLDSDDREEVSLFWIANGALAFLTMMWRAAGLFTRKQLFVEAITARTYGVDLQPQHLNVEEHEVDFSLHQGRRKILLDDMVATGETLINVASVINRALPNDSAMEIVSLFQKPDCLKHDVRLTHCGFSLTGNPWLIGVGLDHFGYYRTQPSLWMLKKEYLPEEYPKHKRDVYPEHPSDVKITVDGEPVAEWYMYAHQANGNGHANGNGNGANGH